MADGVTHDNYLKRNWLAILPLGFIIMLMVLRDKYFYLYPAFLYFNYLLCRIINPDDDQWSITLAEGIILRTSKKYHIGFLGALLLSYKIIYAYLAGLFGGHRSWFSHGWIIGTIGRMIFYDVPFYIALLVFYSYGIVHWNWSKDVDLLKSVYFDIWGIPFLKMQFVAWFYGDGVHLVLDTEWAKGVLYTPKKTTYKETVDYVSFR